MDVIMSTAFGIKSNCIEDPNNEYFTKGNKIFKVNTFWIALVVLVPKIMDFFSIPYLDREVTRFYMNIFQENVKYRQTHNIVRHDFMNLVIQLMERGYVDSDDDQNAINESC